jgi:heptosyltransferase-3
MKVLILQLARLGDIYQTWPAVRALKRLNKDTEIHFLVRPKFVKALEGLTDVSKVHLWPTEEILKPMVHHEPDIQTSYLKLNEALESLAGEKFDWVINLSFSPASSYIADLVANVNTKITGYSRHNDGFLNLPDDMSAYFYAQVGIGRQNRIHITDIFASMLEVDLIEEDWRPAAFNVDQAKFNIKNPFILVHIGASDTKKSISSSKWVAILSKLSKISNLKIILIGTKEEENISESITSSISDQILISYVGKTTLQEVFYLLSHAKLLIGCDSAPIHMASLTNTTTLNISFNTVNFWETGPRAKTSFVYKIKDENQLASDEFAKLIDDILQRKKLPLSLIKSKPGVPSYDCLTLADSEFQWQLIQGIYLGKEFPRVKSQLVSDAIDKLLSANELILEQIEKVESGTPISKIAEIINSAEEVIDAIARVVDTVSPLVRWYQAEKIRIPPGDSITILNKTKAINTLFSKVLNMDHWRRYEQDIL